MSKKKKNKHKQEKIVETPIQKHVMAALKRGYLNAEEHLQALAAAAKAHFDKVWDPNCVQPEIIKTELMLNQAKNQLILTGIIHLKTPGKPVAHTANVRGQMNWDESEAEEELIQQGLLVVQSLVSKLQEEIPKVLPQNAALFYSKYTVGKHAKLNAMAKEIIEMPDVLALLQERKASLEASYRQQLAKEQCPAGFLPVQIASLRLKCSTDGNLGRCALQIVMENSVYFEQAKEYSLGSCPYYVSEERIREYLHGHILGCVKEFAEQEDGIAPLYVAPSIHEIPGMTDTLETLVREGAVSLGHVTVKQKVHLPADGHLLYQLKHSDVYIGRNKADLATCQKMRLRPDCLEHPLVPLKQVTAPPQELAGLCRVGEALEEVLLQTFQSTEVPAPQVDLQLSAKGSMILSCGSESMTVERGERTAGQKLTAFLPRLLAAETGKHAERQRQLSVLNTLNPTELAVLRYVAANRETWYTAAAEGIEAQVCTMKTYTGTCLQRLTEVEIPIRNKPEHLLVSRWAYSRKHDDFRMYRLGASIDREALASAAGRPFGPADVENMRPAERGKWFTQYLLEASEDQRWTRFNEALDCMPRTFLTDFVKSEAGQAFLQGFADTEAMFVRLTVESLPGCKRLAAKLWPEEA